MEPLPQKLPESETPSLGVSTRTQVLAGAAVMAALAVVILMGRARGPQPAPVSSTPAARAAATPSSSSLSRSGIVVATAHPNPERTVSGSLAAKYEGTKQFATGDFQGALDQYLAALKRDPKDLAALNGAGQALMRLNKFGEALPYFTQAIELEPRRWEYRFNRAFTYGKLERWADAVEDYQAAQNLFPDDYSTAFNLGQALHKAGSERRAAAEYERAISLKDDDPTFYLALATTYERLHQPAEATVVYQKFLQQWPTAAEAKQVKGRLAAIASNGSQVAESTVER